MYPFPDNDNLLFDRSSPVEEENSYWLSETFYDDAVRTIRAKDKES